MIYQIRLAQFYIFLQRNHLPLSEHRYRRECDQHPPHCDGLMGCRGTDGHSTWFDRCAVGPGALDNETVVSMPLVLAQ